MDKTDYRPARPVLDKLRPAGFVAVVGPTAVGKTTLIRSAVANNPDLHMLVAGVSRAPRPGEKNGADFHFDSKENMQAKARRGEYVTMITGASGDLYATALADYPTDKIVILAVLAEVMPLFRSLPFKSFRTIFILPSSLQQWRERLSTRDFSPEQLAPRLKEAHKSLEFALNDPQTEFVINDQLDTATQEFTTLASGKPLTQKMQRDQLAAKPIVQDLLTALADWLLNRPNSEPAKNKLS